MYSELFLHKLGTFFGEDLAHSSDSRPGGYRARITPGPPPPDRSYTSSAGTDAGSPSPSHTYVSKAHPAPALWSSVSSADLPVLHPVRLAGVAVWFDPSAALFVQETWISSDCSQGLFPI